MLQATSTDERLAALLTAFGEQQRAGQAPDVAAAVAANPDLAAELRELWAVAQFADMARSTSTLPYTETPTDIVAVPLPREFGDFELLAELGRGGMGVVYKARQKSLNRVVALKMVREAHLASDEDRARFHAEAESAARLKHPNIVTVYEVGTASGQAYFCMEYVEGWTLAERLAKDGPLPPRDAARLVAAIARAVQHAHEQGILHRDLKPSNILLNSERGIRNAELKTVEPVSDLNSEFRIPNSEFQPKVSDFGLAKRIDGTESLTRTGAIVGTPSYMAPEQATGRKDLTPAADVYSLGAILYELLTGRPPFRAATAVDTVLQVLEQEPIPPRDLNPSIDRDVELIALKCLQKPTGLRYESAAALASDLEAYLNGEAISSRPSGLGYVLSRMLRETHHADVLENWGVLWMWHSLMIFLLCLLTQVLTWEGVRSHLYYLCIWAVGLATWGTILWKLRRRAGPVLFVEQQIAHAWAAGVCASIGMFVIEVVAGLPVLTLSPALAVGAGMVMIFKAGILSGRFYLYAGLNFAAAVLMAAVPRFAHLTFGCVSAVSFFVPGLKYYRQRKRANATVV
ncbi:serine/threonine-protein kinase [Limnoglobus roseus]|uniref:non-specific serine/threonine protein kinase n=1 Tax=Limnoglobus roseus TaxID=2598579 RepID=A0A5C1ADB0_9BACT|nr:serine/threonine-protein kinase [Limnoglobus roseus]QEL16137.1 serine/threonine protein kinase [Limnoglobus roseus]